MTRKSIDQEEADRLRRPGDPYVLGGSMPRFEPVDSSHALVAALDDARAGARIYFLTTPQAEDLIAITALWNCDRKRRGLTFNMRPGDALSNILAGFRDDLERVTNGK